MIIGIDASRANRKLKTGTEWYSFHLIKNLAAIDRQNTYWLYLNAAPAPELVAAVKDNPNFVFKYLKWPFHSFWTLGRLSLEMLWRRPDILFVPAHTLPLFGPKRMVNTIHDIAFVREGNLYYSQKMKTESRFRRYFADVVVKLVTRGRYQATSVDYLHWSTVFALKRAAKIIVVSEFTKKEILEIYPQTPPEKIVVVHNGYNEELFQVLNLSAEQEEKVMKKYNIIKPYLLYVGRLEKKKNTPALIEALAILRATHPEIKEKLVLIGNASFGFDEARYVIEEYDLNNDVIIPGWVDEEDLPVIYNAASAFVFPTKHEGFGIPVLEAIACGLPTAASDLPVLREIAGEAVLYFNQNDKRDIAAAMARIVSDEELRRRLRAEGQKRSQSFSWRRCAIDTLAELEKMF